MLLSAAEALVAVAIGVAIPLVPATVLWAAQYGFAPDWLYFWRGAADFWLVGHGVDVTVRPDAGTAAAFGIPPDAEPLRITIALLGSALLTALLGVRAGGRIAETGHRLLGAATALAVTAGLSLLIGLSAVQDEVRPSLVQSTLLPALILGSGLAVGILVARDAPASPSRLAARLRGAIAERPALSAAVAAAIRAGVASTAITILVAAATVAALIVLSYAQLIRLYEALGVGLAGGFAVTVGELALLPNLVVWATSWFAGPGFALGTGSSVSPLGTALGPIPAVPLLGALPAGDLAFGFVGLAVPIVSGFLAGVGCRRALLRSMPTHRLRIVVPSVGLAGGLVGGLLLGLLAWASAGSAGPGRLTDVGPDPILVGAWAALEFGVAITLGLALGRPARVPGGGRIPRLARGDGRAPDDAPDGAGTADGATSPDRDRDRLDTDTEPIRLPR